MERLFVTWTMPWVAIRFTSSARNSMDELTIATSSWSSRNSRQAVSMLTPGFPVDAPWPETPAEPVLPTPTDVPVPEPFDVPVPEPMDVPPPDPHDIPPPQPKQPNFDPRPRSVP